MSKINITIETEEIMDQLFDSDILCEFTRREICKSMTDYEKISFLKHVLGLNTHCNKYTILQEIERLY